MINNVYPTLDSDPFVPVLLEFAHSIKASKQMLLILFNTDVQLYAILVRCRSNASDSGDEATLSFSAQNKQKETEGFEKRAEGGLMLSSSWAKILMSEFENGCVMLQHRASGLKRTTRPGWVPVGRHQGYKVSATRE